MYSLLLEYFLNMYYGYLLKESFKFFFSLPYILYQFLVVHLPVDRNFIYVYSNLFHVVACFLFIGIS